MSESILPTDTTHGAVAGLPVGQLPLVVQTEELDEAAADFVRKHARLEVCHFSETERFEGLLAQAHGLVVRTYTRVNQAMLDKAPNLRVVGRAGVGLDRIDVEACRVRGVEVVHTPDANSQAVAEYVFAMLHDAMRPRLFLDKHVDEARWNQLRKELTAPRQLADLTFGVWGLGRIGSKVARIAHALGMDVVYNDLREIDDSLRCGAMPMPLHDMLKACDVLSIHIDPRPANHKILSTELLSYMKPTAIIINSARGVLVDAKALGAFLWANKRASALIDVHDPEPFGADYPLLGLTNAHLSPHIAAATAPAHANMSWVVRDVVAVLQGRKPEFAAP